MLKEFIESGTEAEVASWVTFLIEDLGHNPCEIPETLYHSYPLQKDGVTPTTPYPHDLCYFWGVAGDDIVTLNVIG